MIELTSKERAYLTDRDLYKLQVTYKKITGDQNNLLSVSEFIELEEFSLVVKYFWCLYNRNGKGPKIVWDSKGYYIAN